MPKQVESVCLGLESFWETCDRESVADHPLVRELCFRLDAIQRYRTLIDEAEANGNDDAVDVLTRHYDQQHELVRKLRDELAKSGQPGEPHRLHE